CPGRRSRLAGEGREHQGRFAVGAGEDHLLHLAPGQRGLEQPPLAEVANGLIERRLPVQVAHHQLGECKAYHQLNPSPEKPTVKGSAGGVSGWPVTRSMIGESIGEAQSTCMPRTRVSRSAPPRNRSIRRWLLLIDPSTSRARRMNSNPLAWRP